MTQQLDQRALAMVFAAAYQAENPSKQSHPGLGYARERAQLAVSAFIDSLRRHDAVATVEPSTSD